jgi:hypothetical protein
MPLLETFANASARGFGAFRPAGGPAGAFEQINTTILASATSSVTFSSIPSTYAHLQIRMTIRGTANLNGGMGITMNGDTGTNYSRHNLFADGGSVYSQNATSQSRINTDTNNAFFPAIPGEPSQFGASIVDILDYTSTSKNKTVRQFAGAYASNGYQVGLISGAYYSTSAINSVTLTQIGMTNFAIGSRFSLYGIKG